MATSVKLDHDLKERLDRLATARQRSAHWMMKQAIQEYVEREEARESFHHEAREAWREYRETGRHVTLAEAETWLNAWGTKDEAAAPKCHE